MMLITPKNWRDFQHYKDRNPPWIRLHRGLLDNFDFQCLPVASRALAPMLWLLASDSVDGQIDATHEKLAFRLRMSVADVAEALKPLIDKGFFEVEQPASKPLAKRTRRAVPETEAETSQSTEAETETTQRQSSPGASPAVAAEKPSVETWKAYATAYENRYSATPVRNAKVNSQLAQFVARIGADESPAVARFFVGHQGQQYVRAMHSTDMLLRDAEKLRTEWATNRQTTHAGAVLADRTQTNLNAFAPLIAEARAKEAQDAQRSVA